MEFIDAVPDPDGNERMIVTVRLTVNDQKRLMEAFEKGLLTQVGVDGVYPIEDPSQKGFAHKEQDKRGSQKKHDGARGVE